MKFNFDSPEPIYLQVAEQLEEAIFTGIYRAGEQVPSTTEMSKEFHINPATALKGMNRLVAARSLKSGAVWACLSPPQQLKRFVRNGGRSSMNVMSTGLRLKPRS